MSRSTLPAAEPKDPGEPGSPGAADAPSDRAGARHRGARGLWGLWDLGFGLLEALATVLPTLVLTAPGERPPLRWLSLCAGALFLLCVGAWRALRRLPRAPLQDLWLRVALAVVAGAVLGGLALRLGLPRAAALLLPGAAALYTPLIDAFRVLWLVLPRARREPLQRRLAQIEARLVVASLCTSAPAVVCTLALGLASARLSPLHLAHLHLLLPPVAVALFLLWRGGMAASLSGIRAALRAQVSDDELARARRAAQLLPYALGLSKLVLWGGASLLIVILGARYGSLDLDSGLLLGGETALVILGAALYEIPWQRSSLAPLQAQLALQRPGLAPPGTLALRGKLLLAFGTLTALSCGLALLWSTQQHRLVAARYTRALGQERLLALQREARSLPEAGLPAALQALLQAHARADVLIDLLPAGGGAQRFRGGADQGAEVSRARRHESRGTLVGPRGQPLGQVVIQQAAEGPEAESAAILALLAAFFVLLLLLAMGLLGLIAADLTRPIRELERRATDVARGDLRRPLLPVATEGDELGRLQHAFEGMRETLAERLRSSTEVHYMLEAQVARRTAELSRRNAELQEALAELQRTQTELLDAERMASMGRLIAGIAHEINNPVNALLNAAGPLGESLQEMAAGLARPPEPEALRAAVDDMQDMARVVQRGARRTREIAQALHNYARGDGGEGREPQPVDLHRCLDESLALVQHHLRTGITVRHDRQELPLVPGHAGQLQQVFMNLLTNAAQALNQPGGGADKEITLRTRREGAQVVVEIIDNGPGIPAEIAPRIFDPFFTTKEVGQGSGLGLSIVHGIVERHGGSIAVDTALGQGTRMIVRLPVGGGGG